MRNTLLLATLAAVFMGVACSGASQELGISDEKNAASPDAGPTPEATSAPMSDGGVPEAGDPDSAPSASVKRVFVTSLAYNGDLASEGKAETGLEGADNICNEHAKQAKLGGDWVAWLSSSTVDAIDRIPDVGPWYLVNGVTKVFPSKFQIPAGPTAGARINVNELGVVYEARVWTGTDKRGRYDATPRRELPLIDNCSNWTSVVTGLGGRAVVGATNSYWTGWDSSDSVSRCHVLNNLYCFEK